MKPTLLVMAAGMGSRYGGLKQIDPVGPNDEIILEYSIYDAIRAGFGKVVFVIRREFEQLFKEAIGNKFTGKIAIDYCFQDMTAEIGDHKIPEGRTKPWGTGHAILMAKNVIKEPFAAINADDFYGRNSYKLIADYLSCPNATAKDYTMCGFELRNTLSENGSVARGICMTDKNSMLTTVVERTNIEKDGNGGAKFTDADGTIYSFSGHEIVSMNMWGFQPSIFTHLERLFKTFLAEKGNEIKSEFYIPFVVDALIKEGNASVKVLPTPDSWFGVTYPGDKPMTIASIQTLVAKGEYPANLWK